MTRRRPAHLRSLALLRRIRDAAICRTLAGDDAGEADQATVDLAAVLDRALDLERSRVAVGAA